LPRLNATAGGGVEEVVPRRAPRPPSPLDAAEGFDGVAAGACAADDSADGCSGIGSMIEEGRGSSCDALWFWPLARAAESCDFSLARADCVRLLL
jgi:hypothetical protein